MKKILLAFLIPVSLFANTGFSFLKIGVSARHAGMGGAGMALPADATAAFWNPSGLAFLKQNTAVLTYNRWIEETKHHFFTANYNTDYGVFALQYIATGVDGIEQREIPSDEPTAVFSSHDICLGFSYSRLLNKNWSVGVTGKYVYERILSDISAIALDLGATYRDENWLFAAAIVNVGRSNEFIHERVALPRGLRLGASKNIFKKADHRIQTIWEISKYQSENIKINMGSEYSFTEKFFARIGYQFAYDAKSWTVGLGMMLGERFELDYAYTPFSRQLSASHRIGIVTRF